MDEGPRQDEMLTVGQVAQRLKLNPETIRRWIRDGKLRATDLGSRRAGMRIRQSDLDQVVVARVVDALPQESRQPADDDRADAIRELVTLLREGYRRQQEAEKRQKEISDGAATETPATS